MIGGERLGSSRLVAVMAADTDASRVSRKINALWVAIAESSRMGVGLGVGDGAIIGTSGARAGQRLRIRMRSRMPAVATLAPTSQILGTRGLGGVASRSDIVVTNGSSID